MLKNFVPPGHEPVSIGSEQVLIRRGTSHPSRFLRRLRTCSPHSASGLAVGAANRFDAVTFLIGTSRSKALGLTARSGPRQFQPRDRRKASSQNALFVAQAYDQLGGVDQAIAVLEVGPPQWRSVPAVRFWLGLSYALAGRKKQAAMEFAAFRALAPRWTVSDTQRFRSLYFTPQFSDRIAALLLEYGVPGK